MRKTVFILSWVSILASSSFATPFVHDEVRDAKTMLKPFWPRTHLAEMKLSNDSLTFGSMDVLTDLQPKINRNFTDESCLGLVRANVIRYEELIRNITTGNLTVLSDKEVDLLNAFNTWGSDVKYALWTLDHWNWVSNDIQCKLSRFHSQDDQKVKTQYCAYEIENGDDVKRNLVVGYCLPDSCTDQETAFIGKRLSESVSRYWDLLRLKNHTEESKVTVDCVLSYQTAAWYTRPQSWIVIACLIILVVLVIAASVMQCGRRRDNKSKPLKIFFRVFSIQSNVKKLLHVSDQAVGSMNGLKTLTMLFMLFCHVVLIQQAFNIDLDKTRDAFRDHPLGPVMYNATYSVGTFFMLGAALQMLITLTKFEESKNKRFSPLLWLCAILNRYLRLVPLLMFTTALLTEVLAYLNFPLWTYIDTARRCPKDYWRQLFLVQNLQKINLCATWTWYLAVDFQLFLLNLPLVCLIQHRPKIGLSLLGILLVISCIIKGWLVLYYNYPPNLMLLVPMTGYEENFSRYSFEIYMRPQGWWSSYLVGLAIGYALFKFVRKPNNGNENDIPAKVYWPVSALTATFILWAVFGIHCVANGLRNSIYDAVYTGLMSPLWAIGWGWVVFACQRSPRARYLNLVLASRPMVFLSNLTYSCYLIHMPIVFGFMYSYSIWMGGRPKVRFTQIEMVVIILLMTLISYLAAFLLNVIVEGPAASVQSVCMKVLFDKFFSRRRPRRDGEYSLSGGDKNGKKAFWGAKAKRRHENGVEADERELEEFSSASLMRPSERFPIRRI